MQQALVTGIAAQASSEVWSATGLKTAMNRGKGKGGDTGKVILVPWYCLLVPTPQASKYKHKVRSCYLLSPLHQNFFTFESCLPMSEVTPAVWKMFSKSYWIRFELWLISAKGCMSTQEHIKQVPLPMVVPPVQPWWLSLEETMILGWSQACDDDASECVTDREY